MKKRLFILFVLFLAFTAAHAQTANELLGKWKLVKWTRNGKDKAVADSTFQVFLDDNKFISIAEGKEHKGKWKLSKDNQTLTIRSGIITVNFRIDAFDVKKRIITAENIGTLEYQKVD